MYRQNIFTRPYIATLRKNGIEIEAVYWAEKESELLERLQAELSEKIEVIRVRERSK